MPSLVLPWSTSATETGPPRVIERPFRLPRPMTRSREELRKQRLPTKAHQENFHSIRAFALRKCSGWPVYGTSGLETSLKLRFFFSRTPGRPWHSRPHFCWAWTPGSEKSSSLPHGEVTQGLEGKANIDAPCGCRANDGSINVDSETISIHQKIARSHYREKKKERKMNKKKKEKGSDNNNKKKN